MPQYLLKEEDITSVGQIPASESMPAQMCMEAIDAGLTSETRKDQLQRICA